MFFSGAKLFKASLLFFMAAGLLALLVMDRGLLLFAEPVSWPVAYKEYTIRALPEAPQPAQSLPPMPDLSAYTMEAMIAKMPALQPGRVAVVRMQDEPGLIKFLENNRGAEFAKRQDRFDPAAVRIESGVYDPASLAAALGDPGILEKSADGTVYALKLPLYIAPGAAFVARGTPGKRVTLRLSANTGAFLVNAGLLFVVDAEVAGWDAAAGTYAAYVDAGTFRPFITTWSGSQAYLGRSVFYDLGYAASKSYGISYSSYAPFMKENSSIPRPTGWILESRFERMHYGFYSYEADDVAVIDNVYANNIVYGIDPHDRSRRLIIAGNEAFGTHKKHGIIVSREVDDSWIVGNASHDNHGSGFMLDRSSTRNLVEGNISYRNEADGMTLFESQDNVLRNNKLFLNGKNGLRIRNSWNVQVQGNIAVLNKGVGMQLYAIDISETEKDRDYDLDPFTVRSDALIVDSLVALNGGGSFKFGVLDAIRLSNVEFGLFFRNFVRGDLDDIEYDIAYGLRHGSQAVEVVRTGFHDAKSGKSEEGSPPPKKTASEGGAEKSE